MNAARIGLMKNQALLLAKANKQAEPGITKVYWFPNEHEVRLLELEECIPPSSGSDIEPFYFASSTRDQLPAPSGIALIRPDEFGRLKLPEDWGGWEVAEELEISQ